MEGNIFRQYDIRGKIGADLTLEGGRAIARAFAHMAAERGYQEMVVGRDNRLSSLALRDVVVEALAESRIDVVDIGEVVTPVFYFSANFLGLNAGIMITASHNPGEYNGFKLYMDGATIFGDEIQKVRCLAEEGVRVPGVGKGKVVTRDIQPDYILNLKKKVQLGPRSLRVVVDCGNGTAGGIAPALLRELGCEVAELFCESDATFPNHFPDPVKVENCQDLIRVVREEKADIGLGFDGDGDRLGVVDQEGNIIWGDVLMILFWREILPCYPGSECIVEVKCSQALVDEIVRLGGKPFFYKTGHSLIKNKMKEIGAVFTGEMSGHMFFADEYYGFDDALYAAVRLLRILSHTNKSLTELLADVPRYYATPEIRVTSTDAEKFKIVQQVLDQFQHKYEIIDVDGARILFPDGWGLVRASNTGPELIVRCEGTTPSGLDRIKDELFSYLHGLGLKI